MQPTKSECLANAKSAWTLYDKAFHQAALCFSAGDLVKAQEWNTQKQAYRAQALDWEKRAKKAKE